MSLFCSVNTFSADTGSVAGCAPGEAQVSGRCRRGVRLEQPIGWTPSNVSEGLVIWLGLRKVGSVRGILLIFTQEEGQALSPEIHLNKSN